jgi:hypothetical protein
MSRFCLLILTAALTFALLAACGDDDDSTDASEATATSPGATSVTKTPASDGGDATATPAEGDEKTPAPEETDGPTPDPTAPGEIPTAPPPATEGIPATAPADETAFLQSLGADFSIVPCAYNPSTAAADCGEYGIFAPNPPIFGQGPECSALVVASTAEGIQCRTAEPLQTKYYEVQN